MYIKHSSFNKINKHKPNFAGMDALVHWKDDWRVFLLKLLNSWRGNLCFKFIFSMEFLGSSVLAEIDELRSEGSCIIVPWVSSWSKWLYELFLVFSFGLCVWEGSWDVFRFVISKDFLCDLFQISFPIEYARKAFTLL